MTSIADLKDYPHLRLSFSHEFIGRLDGWLGLKELYGLPQTSTGIEHSLAYRALDKEKIDGTDVYTTDGDIAHFKLHVLKDNLGFFPRYDALPLVRKDLPLRVKNILNTLSSSLNESTMQSLNAKVIVDKQSIEWVARTFLSKRQAINSNSL